MFIHITDAKYLSDYKVWLKFNSGAEGVVDLENELTGAIYESLQNLDEFKKFVLHKLAKTLVWPNGADFAPEYLFSKIKSS